MSNATTPPLSFDSQREQNKDSSTKAKPDGNGNGKLVISSTINTKRADWDMFAEQDIDSNFDVCNTRIYVEQSSFLSSAF